MCMNMRTQNAALEAKNLHLEAQMKLLLDRVSALESQ